jgi:hypothetical protein
MNPEQNISIIINGLSPEVVEVFCNNFDCKNRLEPECRCNLKTIGIDENGKCINMQPRKDNES